MQINRRNALMLAAGAAASGFAPGRRALAAGPFDGRTLVYATWGGAYQDAQKVSYCDPFVRKTGAKIVLDGPVNSAKLRVMLEGQNYDWQVVCVNDAIMLSLMKDGFLAPVDKSRVDLSRILPEFRHEYGVDIEVGAYTVCYSPTAFGGRKAPQTWADLFDLKTYPGKRMLYSSPQATLEAALLADGVAKDKLYPLDLDRAFKKLDAIKDQTVFFQTHSQSQQLITDGAVSCGYMYSSRAFAAVKKGAKIAISWSQNLRSTTPVIVPKGIANPDLAWAFVNEMLEPENQGRMTNLFVSSPTNPEALKFVDADVLPWLPTSDKNMADGVAIDAAYWGPNLAQVTARWQSWLLT